MPIRVVSIKSFPYRGLNERWSNEYYLTGANPADAAAWKALFDAIRANEMAALHVSCTHVVSYGYNIGSAISNAHVDYTVSPLTALAGSYSPTLSATLARCPGDCAMLLRWTTSRRNSLGRPIWCRKYYHPVISDGLDSIGATQKTILGTLGTTFTNGTLPGGRVLCLPTGELALVASVPAFVTTRTLKRRGKRPVRVP